MALVLLVLAKNSSKSSKGENVLVKAIRSVLNRYTKHQHSEECTSECEQRSDDRLHDMATRLHVLEWEAYGHRKPRSDK